MNGASRWLDARPVAGIIIVAAAIVPPSNRFLSFMVSRSFLVGSQGLERFEDARADVAMRGPARDGHQRGAVLRALGVGHERAVALVEQRAAGPRRARRRVLADRDRDRLARDAERAVRGGRR